MKMKRLLIFAGTSEGRFLIEALRDKAILDVKIATEYGKRLLPKSDENLNIESGRLDLEGMKNLMRHIDYDGVIDTTHPYAQVVTENIRLACEETGRKYIRFLRSSQQYPNTVKVVANMDEAVEFLNNRDGNILLTVGSKELKKFTKVKDYENRIFARVLPMENVLSQCLDYGFKSSQIIGMQGPFSLDMNRALIRHSKANILVTKDTGKAGGFLEKMEASLKEDIDFLVVGRPSEEVGYTMENLLKFMRDEFEIDIDKSVIKASKNFEEDEKNLDLDSYESIKREDCYEDTDYFPIFINSQKMKVLVIGLGNIGKRRFRSLIKFSFKKISLLDKDEKKLKESYEDIKTKEIDENKIELINKDFEFSDLEKVDEDTIVIVATDDEDLNRKICEKALEKTYFVNSISNKKDCSFYFPGISVKDDIVVGVTAQGKNHKLAKKVTDQIRELLREI